MTEPDWIAVAEAELARLSAVVGPAPQDWDLMSDWHAAREAQREEFNTALAAILGPRGGAHPQRNSQGWIFRAGGRHATSTSSWEGAVRNAITAERKRADV